MNRYQALKRIQRVFPRLEVKQTKIVEEEHVMRTAFQVIAWDPFRRTDPSWIAVAPTLDAAWDALVARIEAAGKTVSFVPKTS